MGTKCSTQILKNTAY